MRGFETSLKKKGETLINFVLMKPKRERQEIRNAYKNFFGKELIEEINSSLSGNFRRVVVDLFRTPKNVMPFIYIKQ